MKIPLKFNVIYGMSGSPVAEVAHIIDQDWSYVLVTPSGRTEYKIRWICSTFGPTYKPIFFKKRPPHLRRCANCRAGVDNRREMKRRGIDLSRFPAYAQGFGRMVPRRRH